MPGREHDESADREGEERGDERDDEPAGTLRERELRREARLRAGRSALGELLFLLLGRLLRDVVVGHAATSFRPPPVISIPSCCSVTSAPCSPTIRPS